MAALPYIKLFPADYLADTQHLTLEEHGAYLLLIMNYWQTGNALRAESQRIASVCSTSVENWLKIRPILSEFFTETTDPATGHLIWTHHRIEEDITAVRNKSIKASMAGRKSAMQRAEIKKNSNERSKSVQRKSNHTEAEADTDKRKIKQKENLQPITPKGLNQSAWDEYTKYRADNKIRKLKPASVSKQQRWLVERGDTETQQAIVDQTIRNGHQGLFEVNGSNGNGTAKKQNASQFLDNCIAFANGGTVDRCDIFEDAIKVPAQMVKRIS